MNGSCHTHEWVMSRTWMGHVTHMNGSCHAHEWVMSHTWMGHVTHMNGSCHTHEGVMSHTWRGHVTHMNWSCHTHEWIMSHTYTYSFEKRWGGLNFWVSAHPAKLQKVVCCSLLQSVAVSCSLLQSLAVSCSLLQSLAVSCSVVCGSLLWCFAVCCNAQQLTAFSKIRHISKRWKFLKHSSLPNVLCKMSIELTFENFYFPIWQSTAQVNLSQFSRHSQRYSRFTWYILVASWCVRQSTSKPITHTPKETHKTYLKRDPWHIFQKRPTTHMSKETHNTYLKRDAFVLWVSVDICVMGLFWHMCYGCMLHLVASWLVRLSCVMGFFWHVCYGSLLSYVLWVHGTFSSQLTCETFLCYGSLLTCVLCFSFIICGMGAWYI